MSLAVPIDSSDASYDPAVESAVARLAEEFDGRIGSSELLRVVRDCRRDLGGSPVGALPELVERLARHRLQAQLG
jgi:hypothetical protein